MIISRTKGAFEVELQKDIQNKLEKIERTQRLKLVFAIFPFFSPNDSP